MEHATFLVVTASKAHALPEAEMCRNGKAREMHGSRNSDLTSRSATTDHPFPRTTAAQSPISAHKPSELHQHTQNNLPAYSKHLQRPTTTPNSRPRVKIGTKTRKVIYKSQFAIPNNRAAQYAEVLLKPGKHTVSADCTNEVCHPTASRLRGLSQREVAAKNTPMFTSDRGLRLLQRRDSVRCLSGGGRCRSLGTVVSIK